LHGIRLVVLLTSVMLAAPIAMLRSERTFAQDATDASSVPCRLESAASVAPLPAPVTPVASPAASPAAVAVTPEISGEPADAALSAEIELVVRTLAACQSEGRSSTVAKIVTETYLGQLYGGGEKLSHSDYLALAPDLPAISIAVSSVTDIRTDGVTASADVITVVANELEHGRWTFVRKSSQDLGGMIWQVDSIAPLEIEMPANAQTVSVEMNDDKFTLDQREVDGPNVVLSGENKDTVDHEMLVLRLGRGATTDSLLREPGPGLPDGIEFVGQVTVPAGAHAALALVGLPAGSYAIVCLLPDEDGTPHLALGMQARLTVN
jgi:hypothetical protein